MNRALYAAPLGLAFAALAGCAPKIGSKCLLNTDCGSSGSLVCDTSEPGGYCTQFNCTPNSCQDHAVCVEFLPSVPGCPYDDYASPSRTARTFCMEHCNQDSDCRQSQGYVCADPRQPPWNAAITDDDQSQKVCIVAPDPGSTSASDSGFPEGGVCSWSGPYVPPIDAGAELVDAASEVGVGDAASDGSVDAAMDSGPEAGRDAEIDAEMDAGVAAGIDGAVEEEGAGDSEADAGGADVSSEGSPDASPADAQGGG